MIFFTSILLKLGSCRLRFCENYYSLTLQHSLKKTPVTAVCQSFWIIAFILQKYVIMQLIAFWSALAGEPSFIHPLRTIIKLKTFLSREVFFCMKSHLCTIVSYHPQMLTSQNMWTATQESRQKCPPRVRAYSILFPRHRWGQQRRGGRGGKTGMDRSIFRLRQREPDLRRGMDSKTSQVRL